MKYRLLKIVRDREMEENIEIPTEIDSNDVQCVYKDQNGVSLSLTSGYTVKVAHSFQEMINCFINQNNNLQ